MAQSSSPVVDTTNCAEAELNVPFSARPRLSIVMVTFGTGAVVVDAIASILTNTDGDVTPYEIIVVDNPSPSRSTADLLGATTSGVRLIRLAANAGFGPGNDIGVAAAQGEYVSLCNPDVLMPPGWLPPLLTALGDPVVGVAAPVLVNADGTLQEAGQLLYNDGCTAAVGGPEITPGDWAQAFSRDVDYASAACWMLRRDEYLGFNPRLVPAYFEDVDYALRLESRGQVTRLVADHPVTHLHGASVPTDVSSIAERSREIFRGEWAPRIAAQFGRPTSWEETIQARDRACVERVAVVASSSDDWDAAASAAIEWARRHPRSRASVLIDHAPAEDIAIVRRSGVEVCEGPTGATLANRPGWATQVVVVGGRPGQAVKTATRLFHPRVRAVERLGRGALVST